MTARSRFGPRGHLVGKGHHRARKALLLVLASSLAVVSCSNDDSAGPPEGGDGDAGVALDWSAVGTVDLGSGWTLQDGIGDAPYAAIHHNGAAAGIVELNAYPIDSLDAVTEHLDDGETAALEAHVDEFLDALAQDRATGCGADYSFDPEPRRIVHLGDGPAIRYGFAGARPGEAVTERTLQWAAIRGDVMVLVNVAAYDPASCVSTDGAELTVADLAQVEQVLSEAIEASDLATVVAAVRPRA